MAPHTFRSRLVVVWTLAVLVLVPLGPAWAQSLTDGMDKLNLKYREHRLLIPQLFKGQLATDPNDKQHLEAIDLVAKVATYRVYLDHLENPPTGRIDRAYKEFEGDINEINRNKPMTQPLAEIYRDKVREHALEVIQYDKAKPIHRIYNARVLAKIAEMGQGKPLADTLVTVLKDSTQNDAIHYYALRGLRTLLAQIQPMQMPPLLTKDEESKCAEAIVAFLGRKPNLTAGASLQEKDGFRILRREGVRALAQIHTPEVNDKVRPALVLARFAGDDESLQPPARIDERLEAAIGLAQMKSAQNKQYQPDYAAGQIAKCIGAFAQKTNDEKEGGGKDRTHPWKIGAARLGDALTALKADSGKNAYVAQVADRGMRLLQDIVKGKELNAGEVTWFSTPESDPPSKELFSGVADSVVKPAKPAEAPEK
jgi:hypothetical protein